MVNSKAAKCSQKTAHICIFFLNFLKENCAIVLSGREPPELNNFTFVLPNRGSSVPDYQFFSHRTQYCTEMKTMLMNEVVNLSGIHPPLKLPDHPLLLGSFNT